MAFTKVKQRNDKLQDILDMNEYIIRQSRKSFWVFCQTIDPVFYKDDRQYLKDLCDLLQNLYEDKLINPTTNKPYDNIIINMPPQHGKSRTLTLYTCWIMGRDNKERIMTCSHTDDLAKDFSKYTRDIIGQEKESLIDIIYNDIFPNSKLKRGDSSFGKWALEGGYFNYIGAGRESASITGRSGTIRILDDLVKGEVEAFNEDLLEKIWKWFTGTFLSRRGGKTKTIMCMTRWAEKDPCGKLLTGPTANDWYVHKIEVYNTETNTMLCEGQLSYKDYKDNELLMDNMIFRANYHQETMDKKGKLYTFLQEYTTLPDKPEKIIAVIDTADTGKDYLAMIIAAIYKGQAYIIDIYYTQDPMEITEPETAKRLFLHKANIVHIESNSGGKGFARNVKRLLYDNHQCRTVHIDDFHQSANKVAKILSNATSVMNNIYFPQGWKQKYKEAYEHINSFQRQGTPKHDDIEDALSELAMRVTKNNNWVFA